GAAGARGPAPADWAARALPARADVEAAGGFARRASWSLPDDERVRLPPLSAPGSARGPGLVRRVPTPCQEYQSATLHGTGIGHPPHAARRIRFWRPPRPKRGGEASTPRGTSRPSAPKVAPGP